jgi:pimeloyl-[acyl-carrier protein] methyl ester esterase
MASPLGQHWLLLRGLSREAAHWGDFIALMQQQFPNASVQTLDLPGSGEFHTLTSPSRIPAMTDWLRQQASQRGVLQQPITLLALSMGGMVAWDWAQRYGDDINGTVLVNTSMASLSPFYQRLRWQCYGQFGRLLCQQTLAQRESAIVQLVSNCRDKHADIAKDWLAIQQQRPVSLSNSLRQITAAARYQPAATKPSQPVLLINSQGDRLVSPHCSEAIQKEWDIDLITHPWAGHDVCLDDGAWLANQIKNWCQLPSDSQH